MTLAFLLDEETASRVLSACFGDDSFTESDSTSSPRWAIDAANRLVSIGDVVARLTPTEFSLFMALFDAGGEVVSKTDLIREAWGGEHMATPEALKERISALRRKIGRDRVIVSYGYGYRLSGK